MALLFQCPDRSFSGSVALGMVGGRFFEYGVPTPSRLDRRKECEQGRFLI